MVWSRCNNWLQRTYIRSREVASITAKNKLRQQLGKDMDIAGGSINFSSEKADQCTKCENGIENALGLVGVPLLDMYSRAAVCGTSTSSTLPSIAS